MWDWVCKSNTRDLKWKEQNRIYMCSLLPFGSTISVAIIKHHIPSCVRMNMHGCAALSRTQMSDSWGRGRHCWTWACACWPWPCAWKGLWRRRLWITPKQTFIIQEAKSSSVARWRRRRSARQGARLRAPLPIGLFSDRPSSTKPIRLNSAAVLATCPRNRLDAQGPWGRLK